MDNVFHFMFGVLGNATGLFLFLVPLRIITAKSTEQFSGIPYNMALLNCLLSAWYGLPFISPNNMLVSIINGIGSLLESIYVVVFLIYAPQKLRKKMGLVLILVVGVFSAVVLISLLAFHGTARKIFCGLAATTVSIGMYGSPLSIMRLVVRTKSVEYMPFLLSLFVFLCGTSWFIYGLLGRDPFIAVPNGVGSFLGSVQLLLYVIYRNKNRSGEAKQEENMQQELIVIDGSKDSTIPTTNHETNSISVEMHK